MDSNSVIIVSESAGILTTIVTELVGVLATGLFVVVAAYIAYIYGLKAYFKRREHEQIIKRYLDEGVDRVMARVHQALAVFVDNHFKADAILRQFQQKGKADLSVEFQWFDHHSLELAPYHKITYLVGDEIFWSTIQLLFGLIDGHSEFLNAQFLATLAEIDVTEAPGDGRLKEVQQLIEGYYQNFETFSVLTTELYHITRNLEKQKSLYWEKLDQFKNLSEISASVERMKEKFVPELQKKLGQQQ